MPSDTDPGDPVSGEVEVRLVHPFQARKRYVCPGCNHAVERGIGHVVVVPTEAPDLRRHWHRPCWAAYERRSLKGGRRRRPGPA